MATAFEPSLSTSLRPPFATAEAPSMADSLPSVNFGFEDLRERMARFTMRFDRFIEEGRKRVLEERNQFRMNVAETQEDQRMKKRDIEILTLKSDTHRSTLTKEAQESAEMHTAISSLTTARDERIAHRDSLRAQISEIQKSISARRSAHAAHQRYLDNQSRQNVPELEFWQDYLCLRIEGAGVEDRLKFVFNHVDAQDWDREVWFELGMGKREYEVLTCRPKLEKEAVEGVVDRLNESRELGPFLKGMRELFVASFK